jgi:exodeoxyribonuclease VII large subunit
MQASVITVSALNQAVAQLLEKNIPLTWVSGEISNFTRATSGHWYFTLKDQNAQVRAVMFRGRAQYADFVPREGDKVEVRALVGLYTPRGDFQINVEAIRRAGLGNLYEAFLQLKAKLAAEGLFDVERKRQIPRFIKRIGIITSPQAAALRDVLTTLQRRCPHIEIIIYPSPVQGDGAGAKLAQALATASAENRCDVLLLCRGGGSIEDLWAFNEEVLARTIAHSTIPVISGIGHETDFTISDFVADLRAPTPTAATELAALPRVDWVNAVRQQSDRLQKQMQRLLQTHAQTLDWTSRRLLSSLASIDAKRMQVQHYAQTLRLTTRNTLKNARNAMLQNHTRLQHQVPDTQFAHKQLSAFQHQCKMRSAENLQRQRSALDNMQSKLEMLNPQRTLERGYVILSKADGRLVRSGAELQENERLQLRTAKDTTEFQVSTLAKSVSDNASGT